MKKISSIIALFCAIFTLVSCGGSSNSFNGPKTLDGPLGEYYNIKNVEIRQEKAKPEDKDKDKDKKYVDYTIIVELEKNDKKFDFETVSMKYEYVWDLKDLELGEWSITGAVLNADGEELHTVHPVSSSLKTLLTNCTQPGQTKKIKMEVSLEEEEINVEKTIVISGSMKALTAENIKKIKEMQESLKEASDMTDSMDDMD